MFRFIVVCLLVSFTGALPSSKQHSVSILKNIGGRIINGEPAAPGQFPWQLSAIIADSQAAHVWYCGAILISEEWALTAAHCLDNGTEGTTILSGGMPDDVIIYTDNYIVHPGYLFDSDHLENDIALMHLIYLDGQLVFNDTINAIALSSEELEAGTNVTISGWGDTHSDVSYGLNYVNLVTISNEDCAKVYGDFINSDMVCATSDTSEPKGFCEGDSGGPLVANLDSDPVLVGIASFVSSSGCESGLPSGYTRIANYRDWIQENTGL